MSNKYMIYQWALLSIAFFFSRFAFSRKAFVLNLSRPHKSVYNSDKLFSLSVCKKILKKKKKNLSNKKNK